MGTPVNADRFDGRPAQQAGDASLRDAVEPGALCALCLGGLYPACPARMTMLGLGGSAEGSASTVSWPFVSRRAASACGVRCPLVGRLDSDNSRVRAISCSAAIV